MEFVTGSNAYTPRTHSQWVAGPGRTPKGWAVEGRRAPDPRRPTPRQVAPPPGTLVPPPQRAKPACKSAPCRVGDRFPRPHLPHPQQVGGRPRPQTPKNGQSGVGERPTPNAPH